MSTCMRVITALTVLLLLSGCGGDESGGNGKPSAKKDDGKEPDYVTVDHILIGVKGPRLPQARDKDAARKLAYELLDKLKAGGDWTALKRQHSDDPPPGGPYAMANHGKQPQGNMFPRAGMAPAFGDVGFALDVGEIRMADHHPQKSPFGYHIIKRVR